MIDYLRIVLILEKKRLLKFNILSMLSLKTYIILISKGGW